MMRRIAAALVLIVAAGGTAAQDRAGWYVDQAVGSLTLKNFITSYRGIIVACDQHANAISVRNVTERPFETGSADAIPAVKFAVGGRVYLTQPAPHNARGRLAVDSRLKGEDARAFLQDLAADPAGLEVTIDQGNPETFPTTRESNSSVETALTFCFSSTD